MILKYRTAAAAVLASLLLASCPVLAAGGGGGGTSEDSHSNTMTYVTIGLAVVVGGLLFLDVITGSDEEAVSEDSTPGTIIDTGVNWDDTFPEDTSVTTVAVSVFSGENGFETAMEFISILNELTEDNVAVYADPLDLGSGSPVQKATAACNYFGADYIVFQFEDSETLLYGVASPDSILLTSVPQSDNNILSVVREFLQKGIFN